MEQFSTVALRSWLPRKSCKNFNSTTNDVTKMLTISVCRQCQSAVGDIQMWCMMMQLSVVPMDRPISLVRIYRNTRCCPLAFLSQVAWRPWYRFVRADDSQRQSCSLYKKYNDVIKLETVESMQGHLQRRQALSTIRTAQTNIRLPEVTDTRFSLLRTRYVPYESRRRQH